MLSIAPDHPHRGQVTVTYLIQGSTQHLDSFGHKGDLKPGDVQWMVAGRGLVHSEVSAQQQTIQANNTSKQTIDD